MVMWQGNREFGTGMEELAHVILKHMKKSYKML
jgi:hypothetical protein